MPALVSVLIPCYNAEKWLGDALRSVASQTWRNLEVICVDDGSKDESLSIARSFEGKNVKVLTQPNQGAPRARNRAYEEAQGDFIQFLDADDFLSRDKIEAQVNVLLDSPADFIAVSPTLYFNDGTDPARGVLHDGWPVVDSDNPREWLIELYGPERGGMVQPGAWLTPRSITDSIGPWNESLARSPNDDGEYFARVVLRSKGIRRTQHGVSYYRKFRDGRSLSSSREEENLVGALRAQDLMRQALLADGQEERARKALARLYKDLAFRAYPFSPEISKAALARAAELGFGEFRPRFPTAKGRYLAGLLGWRIARRIGVHVHRMRSALWT